MSNPNMLGDFLSPRMPLSCICGYKAPDVACPIDHEREEENARRVVARNLDDLSRLKMHDLFFTLSAVNQGVFWDGVGKIMIGQDKEGIMLIRQALQYEFDERVERHLENVRRAG